MEKSVVFWSENIYFLKGQRTWVEAEFWNKFEKSGISAQFYSTTTGIYFNNSMIRMILVYFYYFNIMMKLSTVWWTPRIVFIWIRFILFTRESCTLFTIWHFPLMRGAEMMLWRLVKGGKEQVCGRWLVNPLPPLTAIPSCVASWCEIRHVVVFKVKMGQFWHRLYLFATLQLNRKKEGKKFTSVFLPWTHTILNTI